MRQPRSSALVILLHRHDENKPSLRRRNYKSSTTSVHSGLKKLRYIDDISSIYRVSFGFNTKQDIDYRLTEKSIKKSNLSSIYQIQSDISDSKRYIEDTAGCVEIPKIAEDYAQNSNRIFKQIFKFSNLCKVQT